MQILGAWSGRQREKSYFHKREKKSPITRATLKHVALSVTAPEYIEPCSFSRYRELVALQSTRKGGVSQGPYFSLNMGNNTGESEENVRENTRRLCAALSVDPQRMVSSEQVHGTKILSAKEPGRYHGYDAFITDTSNLFLCIYTADCYPILLYDPEHHAAGAVHAGWKGSAGRIVMQTIEAMQQNFNSIPAQCIAYIGTGIGAAAYEVGHEVAREFSADTCTASTSSNGGKKYMLDLGAVNYQQLIASGLEASNIERSPFCSFRESDMFFSYRRDQGKTGRMVSLIGVRS